MNELERMELLLSDPLLTESDIRLFARPAEQRATMPAMPLGPREPLERGQQGEMEIRSVVAE